MRLQVKVILDEELDDMLHRDLVLVLPLLFAQDVKASDDLGECDTQLARIVAAKKCFVAYARRLLDRPRVKDIGVHLGMMLHELNRNPGMLAFRHHTSSRSGELWMALAPYEVKVL
jgi:hypothetical protein